MYNLDQNAAKEADNFNQYLDQTGKYKGVFTRAESLVSKSKGTKGIGFTFQTDDKRTTRFDIWTEKGNGEKLSGFNTVMAIMQILKARNIKPMPAIIEKYDFDTKKIEKVEAEVFQDLMNKPIGVLLRNTEYEKFKDNAPTGNYAWRLELFMVFDAQTEFTASEIIDKKTIAERLPSIIATLEDRPLKNKKAGSNQGSQMPDSGYFPDMDDIGF